MTDILPGAVLEQARRLSGLTQGQLARLADTSQPAIARLESGAASPTIATLERILRAAGFQLRLELQSLPPEGDAVVERYKRDVDRTLIVGNLRKSVSRRIRELVELQKFDAELQRAMRVSRTKKA